MGSQIDGDETESMRGYARCRRARGLPGGTLRAVQRARDAGRLVMTPDKRVLVAASDALWAATATDPDSDASAPGPAPESSAPPASLTPDERRYYDQYDGLTAAQLKAEMLRIRAAKERADLEVRMGQLIETQRVERDWFEFSRMMRDQVLGVPDRHAESLASERDWPTSELYEVLTFVTRDICTRISDEAAKKGRVA